MATNIKKLTTAITLSLCTSSLLLAGIGSNDINTTSLKSASVSSDVDTQLEKIYKDVREFHIFKQNFNRWSGTDTFTTLIVGDNSFPVFSPRSDKDPSMTEYPINYNSTISRYTPVRPPASVLKFYTDNNIALGNEETATYNAPIVSAGVIGKGRVLTMGSTLYGSVLVNPRNYSNNGKNRDTNISYTPDSADMENFFHNIFSWLSEQNPNEELRYSKTGTATKILSNKTITYFWSPASWGVENDKIDFEISENFNLDTDANPKVTPTWKDASDNGILDPSVYPLIILEDFELSNSNNNATFMEHTLRKTALNEVELIVNYIREGGGVLIMESPRFNDKYGITQTASNEILKLAGITTFFENNKQDIKILPKKTDVGGVSEYDMCLVDYINHTDLIRRLEMEDYSNVPTTLDGLKELLTTNGKISYLEEVLDGRDRNIFSEGNETSTLTTEDCGEVEITLENGSKENIQTILVKGDGIIQDDGNYDKYANYPIDLNFVQAQGDMGGSMNTLLAHELGEEGKQLSKTDLNREYTNMGALLLNDAEFSGDKFVSLNEMLDRYKSGGDFTNTDGEFYAGFNFTTKEVLDFRVKPVTRIMLERAFYDENLKYDPSQFPGETTDSVSDETATIYLKRNTSFQKWYAGNMQSTGLYAPAHTDITVTLPDDVNPEKMQLIIAVGDNVGGMFRHEINLKRPPKMVKKYKFLSESGSSSRTITVQHPYGGLIFLKSFDSSAENGATASISFTNVQKSVRFVLGETTSDEWNTIKNGVAPKAELESKHYILTVPRANMASLSFERVTEIANEFDEMAVNAYDFYGYDRGCSSDTYTEHTPPTCESKKAHKHREVFDPHISIGSGHSGYPLMVMNWKPSAITFPQDAKKSFLLWHEMGHNMVESWLGINGATEVANNVMCLHQQKRFGASLTTDASIANVGIILAKGQPWADGGDFGRLLMFHQLPKWIEANYLTDFKSKNAKYYETDGSVKSEYPFLDGDGFDIYKILHREARDRATSSDKYDSCMKQSGKTKTDMLAICTSTILELDTKPFFEAWKAGVVGIGNVDGVNIYDIDGGISSGLSTGYTTLPNPSIESYVGE